MSQIQIDNVKKSYGSYAALRGVDLVVGDGELVALLGPSGCGKTTLLRAVAGLEYIDSGQIRVGEVVMSGPKKHLPPERRNVGMVFQSYALWPHMNVFGNIAYGLSLRGWKREAIDRRVTEVLDIVDLPGLEKRYPAELSGGQMQRVAVARSLAAEPTVLLFDEPLSNLDAKMRERMRFEIRRIQERVGITAIYVTHDQAEAMVIADRIILMEQGRIIQQGDPRQLYDAPVSRFAADFLGASNFLHADLIDLDRKSGHARYRLSAGQVLTGMPPGATGAESVELSIRPERLEITPADESGLQAVIERVVYQGNLVDVFLLAGDTPLRAQDMASRYAELHAGDAVSLHVAPEHVRVVAHSEPSDG
jgi:ABC-type Fe3+/spermidine/putrescine transport system ATPase subunit